MSNLKLAAALRAAAAVLESGEEAVTTTAAAVNPVAALGDKICDFLRNDQSGFDWRSAGAIAKAIDSTPEDVARAATAHAELQSRQSRGQLGLLISLA
jgi:hypothetical protein